MTNSVMSNTIKASIVKCVPKCMDGNSGGCNSRLLSAFYDKTVCIRNTRIIRIYRYEINLTAAISGSGKYTTTTVKGKKKVEGWTRRS